MQVAVNLSQACSKLVVQACSKLVVQACSKLVVQACSKFIANQGWKKPSVYEKKPKNSLVWFK
jgi:hypothetical protein